ncbi:MLP-like protein 423 [Papaver somniferum]|uniref:MLP-like protein 423 n=1 Tax=Papaver somniferum TaxID=3469 RepID=UPI000E70244E|nr:MLP-like protein 423 [Papaver somniferum]
MHSTFQNMLLKLSSMSKLFPELAKFVWEVFMFQTYAVMGDKPRAVMTKVEVTAVDHKNMSVTFTVIEGELKNGFTSFASTQSDGNYKCLVKWSARYQKANEEVPDPTYIKKWVEDFFKELDTNLLKEE